MASQVLDYGQPDERYPDLRDVHERIGRALCMVIALTHRIAFAETADGSPISDDAALRTLRPDVLDVHDDAAPVLAKVGPFDGGIWAWNRFLMAPESAACVRPNAIAETDPGRWVRQVLPDVAACSTHRYYAHVDYISAQTSNEDLWNACRSKTPAIFVSPLGDKIEEQSQTYAFHRLEVQYRLRFLSANWRGGVAARFGGPIADEARSDPGTNRMIGDLRRLLVHENRLLNLLGVTKCTLGPYRPVYEKSVERIIVDQMDLTVVAHTYTPNTPCEIVSPWKIWMDLQDELGRSSGPPNQIPGAPHG